MYLIFGIYGRDGENIKELEGKFSLSSNEEIIKKWKQFSWGEKAREIFGKKVKLAEDRIGCLKNTRRASSIWKIELKSGTEFIPMVLKIYYLPINNKRRVELNMLQKANPVYKDLMPRLYWVEDNVNSGEIWLFMEYIEPLTKQIKLTPKDFGQIIPSVAKFHSVTFEERLTVHEKIFEGWLPHYTSEIMEKERIEHIHNTMKYLDDAMKNPDLKDLLGPRYNRLQRILQKGPIFFPEIIGAGQSLIHGDLHIHNICSKNASEDQNWTAQLIDWESARIAPSWYDLVVLVEILIDFRGDWHKKENEIREFSVDLYSQEMKKHGITFSEDPLKLLKMTYLQRVLEKRLLNHLRKVLNGEQSLLLNRYLEKIDVWGKELGLY